MNDKIYMKEFQYWNGESFITFDMLEMSDSAVVVAVTNEGKITIRQEQHCPVRRSAELYLQEMAAASQQNIEKNCGIGGVMSKYFRITAYHKDLNKCFIIDCNGVYEKQSQFTFFFYEKGFEILEVGDSDKFLDVDIKPVEVDTEKFALRAEMDGRPIETKATVYGVRYRAIMVEGLTYIPNRYARV